MRLTTKRISLYLTKVKTLVNYHIKLRDRNDRVAHLQAVKISALLAETEEKLRALQQYLVRRDNERAQEPNPNN